MNIITPSEWKLTVAKHQPEQINYQKGNKEKAEHNLQTHAYESTQVYIKQTSNIMNLKFYPDASSRNMFY